MENTRQYRGKRKSDGKWVYGYLIGTNWIVGEVVDSSEEYICPEFWYNVIPETVGICTNESDSKGEHVYSGDIVEDSEARYEIRYGSWTDAFDCGGVGFYLYPVFESESYVGALNPSDMKVLTKIGTAHDNPELLVK